MYRVMTGRLPVGIRIKEPKDLNPEVRNALNEVIIQATEHEADVRFQSASEMLEMLDKVAGGGHVTDVIKKTSPVKKVKSARMKKAEARLRSKSHMVLKKEAKQDFGLDYQLQPKEYVKNEFEDNGDGTITDHATSLMWQQSGSNKQIKYKDTENYISRLNGIRFVGTSFADYRDWRLPTVQELMSLLEEDKQSNGLYINPIFDNKQRWCWSANILSLGSVWGVNFSYSGVRCYYLNYGSYARAVRSK